MTLDGNALPTGFIEGPAGKCWHLSFITHNCSHSISFMQSHLHSGPPGAPGPAGTQGRKV